MLGDEGGGWNPHLSQMVAASVYPQPSWFSTFFFLQEIVQGATLTA